MSGLFDIPNRLLDIFPPGLDSKSSSSHSGGSYYQFAPDQLFRTLTQRYVPEHHVESMIVKSISYGKQKKGARHEFLVVEVFDPEVQLTNHVVIDRNNDELTEKKNANQTQARFSQSCQGLALDAFKVSYDGNVNQLLQGCRLLRHQYLEKIEFGSTDSKPLFLYQLVTLVYGISRGCPIYALAGKNCYWFAGLIWECLRALRPHAKHHNYSPGARGLIPGVPVRYTPDREEIKAKCNEFKQDIEKVDAKLSHSWERWMRSRAFELLDSSDP